jgi:hypothetical protein
VRTLAGLSRSNRANFERQALTHRGNALFRKGRSPILIAFAVADHDLPTIQIDVFDA